MALTMKQAAQTALDCQDACNLSGVLASFKEIVHETLWPEARALGKGTDWVNKHPIVTLFLDKLCDLNGKCSMSNFAQIDKAYEQCRQIAKERIELADLADTLRPITNNS